LTLQPANSIPKPGATIPAADDVVFDLRRRSIQGLISGGLRIGQAHVPAQSVQGGLLVWIKGQNQTRRHTDTPEPALFLISAGMGRAWPAPSDLDFATNRLSCGTNRQRFQGDLMSGRIRGNFYVHFGRQKNLDRAPQTWPAYNILADETGALTDPPILARISDPLREKRQSGRSPFVVTGMGFAFLRAPAAARLTESSRASAKLRIMAIALPGLPDVLRGQNPWPIGF